MFIIFGILNTFQDFFRRSVRLGKQYVCVNDQKCEVTPETRNDCKYCRLKKCFDVGMPHDGKQCYG